MDNDLLQKTLCAIANQQGLSAFCDRVNVIRPDIITIKVALLGEFNAGKSTLINALLRRKVLPMFATPTTACITEISAGDMDEAVVEYSNGEEVLKSYGIPWSELAAEILRTDLHKKILIRLKDIDLLAGNLLLIDTPGITSIQDTHDDITYGYLPQTDIAIIVINPNAGAVPMTLIRFLSQFPRHLLDKIYFVVGRVDEVPETDLGLVIESIRNDLGKLFVSPRVLSISGLMALEGKDDETLLTRSGIKALENIIRYEVPAKKEAIEQHRVRALLLEEAEQLIQLLKKKSEAVDWSTDKFDEEIQRLNTAITTLQKDISGYRQKFTGLRDRAIQKIGRTVGEYAGAISAKSARDDSYDDLIVAMVGEIKTEVEASLNELKVIQFVSFDNNMGGILQAMIEKEVSQIKDIASLFTDAATFALTAWIVPGATPGLDANEALAGAGVLFAEHTEKKGKGLGKILGTIGQMIKGINPLEKLKTAILPHVLNPTLSRLLTQKMTSRLRAIYDTIGETIEREIETRYLIPLKDNESLLLMARQAKSKKMDQSNDEKMAIDESIAQLTLLK